MNSNFHTHCFYCRHAQGTVEDYVNEAIKNDLKVLGFSDHGPFPDQDYGSRMPYEEFDLYLEDLEKAKEKFKDKIKIKKSVEIEYLKKFMQGRNFYEYLLNEKQLDYLLLGQHFFYDRGGIFHNIYFTESPEVILEYALSVKEALETGLFKIIAHPDIFGIGEFSWSDYHEKACDIIIESAEKNKVILEFNANGVRRGKKNYPDGERYQYPLEKFWKKVSETSIPVLVGSDCHNPSQVWDDFVPESKEIVKKLGCNLIEDF